jgi:hypothetical protein
MTTAPALSSTQAAMSRSPKAGSVWRAGLAAAAGAAAVNLVIFLAARAADASLSVRFSAGQTPMRIAAGHVVVLSFVALAIGTGLTALAAARLRRGIRAGQRVGTVIALVSTIGPLSLHTDSGTKVALTSMHLVAGAVFVIAMQRVGSPQRAIR